MKTFWQDYVYELILAASIGTFVAVRKFINWFIKIKCIKPVEELKESLTEFQRINEKLFANLQLFSDNLQRIETATNYFKDEVKDNIDRIITTVDKITIHLEDVKNKFDEKMEVIREKVESHSKELAELRGEHKTFHSKHK